MPPLKNGGLVFFWIILKNEKIPLRKQLRRGILIWARKVLYPLNFYVSAKHVGIGIRRFSKKILIVGLYGEQSGIYPR